MARFPETDIPMTIPTELEMRLQSGEILDGLHEMAEADSHLYPIAHRAVQLVGGKSLETPELINALETGIKVYEIVGALVDPDRSATAELEGALALESARRFLDTIKSRDDFFALTALAEEHTRDNAPELVAFVEEVAGHYTKYDKFATQCALKGAAAIRGMQIFVDRRVAQALSGQA